MDDLLPENGLEEYSKIHGEFVGVFENEEKVMQETEPQKPLFPLPLAEVMIKGRANGSFWFFHALGNPKGLFLLFFCRHLMPRYGDSNNPNFYNVLSFYWALDAADVVEKKPNLKHKKKYEAEPRKKFTEDDDP